MILTCLIKFTNSIDLSLAVSLFDINLTHFRNMKTNMLWQCQYCDRKLRAKRTVLKHISTKHGADGENPVMYSEILVSPKDIKGLVQSSKNNPEKVDPAKDNQEVMTIESGKVSTTAESAETSKSEKEKNEDKSSKVMIMISKIIAQKVLGTIY